MGTQRRRSHQSLHRWRPYVSGNVAHPLVRPDWKIRWRRNFGRPAREDVAARTYLTSTSSRRYSPRRTRIGSIDMAPLAGRSEASNAAVLKTPTLRPIVHGSTGFVSYSRL